MFVRRLDEIEVLFEKKKDAFGVCELSFQSMFDKQINSAFTLNILCLAFVFPLKVFFQVHLYFLARRLQKRPFGQDLGKL